MTIFETIDQALTGAVSSWSVYSTALATILVLVVSYRVLSAADPDIHPMLLARQSAASTVRREGQSAVYRSQIVPHGTPLRTGLNIKDAGAPKWSRGRDGDLRDIWLRAAKGNEQGGHGRLLTVRGAQNVTEHSFDDISRQISLVGRHIAEQGGIRVAVYLPNSWEAIATLLACSFQPGLTCVVLPYDVPEAELVGMLRRGAVDTVVTASGGFPLDTVAAEYKGLRSLVWVVDGAGASSLDWSEVPEGAGGSVSVTTWRDIVDVDVRAELPGKTEEPAGDVVLFWAAGAKGGPYEMVRFTQANLVAGVSGQLAGLPAKERLDASDLFLAADSLAHSHTLTLTLAALFSHASVALNSVAEQALDLELATVGIAPTVVTASPGTLLATRARCMENVGRAPLARLGHTLATRTLSLEGVFSPGNLLSAARPVLGTTPGKLRLLYVAERAGDRENHLDTGAVSDLRVITGARVVHALSAARVAGAVCQTALYDYRVGHDHFGAPLPSVEVFLVDKGVHTTTDDKVEGEVCSLLWGFAPLLGLCLCLYGCDANYCRFMCVARLWRVRRRILVLWV